MIGSIIRVLLFGAVVVGLAWGATFLIENPGGITITWDGREYPPISAIEFVLAILALALALVILFKLLGFLAAFVRFLTGDDNAISRFFDRSREQRGLEALAAGMRALAAGDAVGARAKADKAERLLMRPELTRLLNAQAAQLAGDEERARTYWRALASEPETQYIGVKGLLSQAVREGDHARALKLARRAFDMKSDDPEVLEALYALQIEHQDWDGARRTVAAQRRAAMIEKAEQQRLESEIALMEARQAENLGEEDHARKLAIEAAKRDPSHVDAVVAAARHLTAAGSLRIAARLIVDAWRHNPDPVLAAAFAAIEPDEGPTARRLRFDKLIEANPDHPESRLLAAELALVAGDWAGARKVMGTLGEEEMNPRRCAIMAAIARCEGRPEAEVRGWLARALGARVEEDADSAVDHAAMLPLIIGEDETTTSTDPFPASHDRDGKPEDGPPATIAVGPPDVEPPEEPEKAESKPAA